MPTSQVGLQSKRPQVKNVGQNVPKMNFYSICYEILGTIWDV